MLWNVTIVLVYKAILRLLNPVDVDGKLMFLLATIGASVNGINFLILYKVAGQHGHGHGEEAHDHGHGGGSRNINLRAALVHVFGDSLQAIGVMIASILIWWNPSWRIVDPLCTFTFAILVFATSSWVLKKCIKILLENIPEGINFRAIHDRISSVPNVLALHDLHIWSLSVGKHALTTHVTVNNRLDSFRIQQITQSIEDLLQKEFQISHSTIQIQFAALESL